MTHRLTRRALTAAFAVGTIGLATLGTRGDAQSTTGDRTSGLVRGNKPGEWRYWGADAWSTRYSPLDQINASNFDSLAGRVAVERRRVRRRRVLPHDAALRERTAVHRRHHAPHRRPRSIPDNGETLWMWRLDEGHPLAEGAAPVRRPRPRLLDRRRRRSASSSSRPATTWRRSTRRPACPIRSSARTASST